MINSNSWYDSLFNEKKISNWISIEPQTSWLLFYMLFHCAKEAAYLLDIIFNLNSVKLFSLSAVDCTETKNTHCVIVYFKYECYYNACMNISYASAWFSSKKWMKRSKFFKILFSVQNDQLLCAKVKIKTILLSGHTDMFIEWLVLIYIAIRKQIRNQYICACRFIRSVKKNVRWTNTRIALYWNFFCVSDFVVPKQTSTWFIAYSCGYEMHELHVRVSGTTLKWSRWNRHIGAGKFLALFKDIEFVTLTNLQA